MLERLWLRIDGPFAAFRTFSAGWYRPTAPFMTHSAAYGLFLNLAGIESRLWEGEEGHDGKTPASLERDGLPQARIALGIPAGTKPPVVQTLYQQLHNYLQNPARQDEGYQRGKGAKFNITPVRREFLWKFHAIAVIESSPDLIRAIRRGLRGEKQDRRYGLPFLGDNNFLPDRLEEVEPTPARWFRRLDENAPAEPETTRLTQRVDRSGMVGTESALFAPTDAYSVEIPESAWAAVGG